eukprot:TRINITY_DN3152_c0_g2_i1.p2 TRINITY_DN3152_c0_g2~~TRINITY_DN3152_c0_g2_i1.p2  ORF type:complete len:118 (+),score=7.38 TRINITY_DN3152_c0_g2_i1:859-1212(+)
MRFWCFNLAVNNSSLTLNKFGVRWYAPSLKVMQVSLELILQKEPLDRCSPAMQNKLTAKPELKRKTKGLFSNAGSNNISVFVETYVEQVLFPKASHKHAEEYLQSFVQVSSLEKLPP